MNLEMACPDQFELLSLYLDTDIQDFYALGLKGQPGASSVWIVRPSVWKVFVRNSRPAYEQSAIFKVWVVIQ